jgi:long-chain fatty acid transport protein
MANTTPVAGRFLTYTAAGLLSLASAGVMASGFALIEQSVNGMGSAYAIGSAGIDDASTVFYNPASMSRLSGTHLNGGLQIVSSRVEFDGSAQYNPNNLALGAGGLGIAGNPINGKTNPDTNLLAGVPSGYISHQYSDKVWFGLGVNAPFGLETDYSNDWVGRYNAVKSQLLTVNINPTIAFKFTDHATIGFGLNALYADGKLTQQVDGALASIFAGGSCGSPPGTSTCDGKAKLTGNDWGFGYNFGLLLEPTENTRFGFNYRSAIDLNLDGNTDVTGLPAPITSANGKQGAKLELTLPDSLSVSAYHAFNSHWAIMADVTWTQWSQLDTLDIELADGSQSVANWDYEDSTRYAIGAEYRYNQTWTFRSGVALDETPVPNDNLRSPRVPDADRYWLSFGTTYRYSPDLTFDFGYAHLFVDDPKLDNVSDNNDPTLPYPAGLTGFHTVSGKYDASVDIFGAAVNWKF